MVQKRGLPCERLVAERTSPSNRDVLFLHMSLEAGLPHRTGVAFGPPTLVEL